MPLLDTRSLSTTVDNVNARFFAEDPPNRSECGQAIDWILTRFAAPTAYGRTFGITPQDERIRLHTFTGEALTSPASLRHIHAEEACRALILLNRRARRRLPQLDEASDSLLASIRKGEDRGKAPGTFCCGPCTVALWRHLAVGGLGSYAKKLDQGMSVLQSHRDGKGAWRRFPFFYTLSALLEADGPNGQRELQYAKTECARRLRTARTTTTIGQRRYALLTRVAEGSK